jgi:mRNA interferase MazF
MSKSKKMENIPRIGDVYVMQFDGVGSEQGGRRPGVVFQNNIGNAKSPNIIALPLTSVGKKPAQPTHVKISADDTGLKMDSMVLCENPERMSKEKIGSFICRLPDEYMKKIAVANLLATSAISFLDISSLVQAWRLANKLNAVAA